MESKDLVVKPWQNTRLQNVWGSWGRTGRGDLPDNPGEVISLARDSQDARRENIVSGVAVEAFPWI